ncbi:MAG: SpoIVB peptidase S55 domain-containing protein [Acidobacteriota bacterium]
MTRRVPPFVARAVACLGLALLGTPLVARDTVMPVSEVRPGMVGVGRTVFRGAAVEDFTVRIIGVLKSVVAPQRDLILAKLEGGPLANTGVIAGMSGSPVYIDGKLLGAVSYQLGQFPKEPIAGITPIGEMTEATALTTARAIRPVAISLAHAVPAADLLALWRTDLGPARGFGASAADVIASLLAADLPRPIATDLRPIAVPLVVGGVDAGALERLLPALATAAFVTTQAAAVPASAPAGALTLAPGDAIGVALMSGDFSMGATGTVTHVDGDRVYAFGHPLYNLGPTQFPMTRADVIAVLPSLVTSSKLASLGPVVGTMSQDRATAIAGRLGPAPALVPVTVTLTSGRAPSRTFSFGVVNDQLFTPLLTYLAVANVLTSYERQTGAATYVVRGDARIHGQQAIHFDDVFVGDQGAANASAYVAGPLTALYRNATEPFTIDGIDLTIEAAEETRTAEIERVWLDDPVVRPGRDVKVYVQLRTFRGETQRLEQTIAIPANATGTLQLLVSDGTRLGLQEALRRGELQSVAQIVRAANRSRRDHRVYVRLSATAPGAVIDGELLPGLPASVAAVIDADRPASGTTALRSVTRGDWEIAVPFAVNGSRQLTLVIDAS